MLMPLTVLQHMLSRQSTTALCITYTPTHRLLDCICAQLSYAYAFINCTTSSILIPPVGTIQVPPITNLTMHVPNFSESILPKTAVAMPELLSVCVCSSPGCMQ